MRSVVLVMALFLMMLFDGAVLEKDSLDKARVNIKGKTGELKGWMKEDLLQPNRVNVYDRYGNMKGFWVRDSLNPDAWIFKRSE